MSEQPTTSFEERSRRLFENSVDSVDMRIRSRLNQARHAALEAQRSRPKWGQFSLWSSAAGFSAAAVLGAVVWFGSPLHRAPAPATEAAASFEDLDIVAASDEGAGDNLEMLQDDLEFYDWAAQKNSGADPGSVG